MRQEAKIETTRLIERIRAKEAGAFEAFVQKYQRLVFHMVYRMIPNTSDQEDLCQDIFLKIYKNLSEFRYESKISTWICQIAHYTCLNYIKKKKTILLEDQASDQQAFERFSEDSYLPDKQTEMSDLSRCLQAEILKLPIQHRTAITLFHLEEMPISEMVQVMRLPEGTIKSLLHRARKMLKNTWTHEYKEEICC